VGDTGATGAVGATGPTGPTGATGATGAAWDAAQGITAKTAAFTVAAADVGKLVTVDTTAAAAVVLPTGIGATGQIIDIAQLGAGKPEIIPGAGVTVRNLSGLRVKGQYGRARIQRIGADTWQAYGDLETGAGIPALLSPDLWLDADDATTITASGSPAKVSQWNDKSGNGYNVAQATGAAQPSTGAATQNGRNVLSFDGNDHLVSGTVALPAGNTARTLVAVAKRVSGQYVFGWGGAASNLDWSIDVSAAGGSQRIVAFANDWATGQAANTTWEIAQGWHDGTNARYQINNGTVRGPHADSYNTTATPAFVGVFSSLVTGWLTGEIAEILVFSRVLTADEFTALRDYLNAKWGVF
jgi:hypothetical protein